MHRSTSKPVFTGTAMQACSKLPQACICSYQSLQRTRCALSQISLPYGLALLRPLKLKLLRFGFPPTDLGKHQGWIIVGLQYAVASRAMDIASSHSSSLLLALFWLPACRAGSRHWNILDSTCGSGPD